jgi:hypothetical protein
MAFSISRTCWPATASGHHNLSSPRLNGGAGSCKKTSGEYRFRSFASKPRDGRRSRCGARRAATSRLSIHAAALSTGQPWSTVYRRTSQSGGCWSGGASCSRPGQPVLDPDPPAGQEHDVLSSCPILFGENAPFRTYGTPAPSAQGALLPDISGVRSRTGSSFFLLDGTQAIRGRFLFGKYS